jgi:hypothetical protein
MYIWDKKDWPALTWNNEGLSMCICIENSTKNSMYLHSELTQYLTENLLFFQ